MMMSIVRIWIPVAILVAGVVLVIVRGGDETSFEGAAALWGADLTRFSVHGSTHPNQALCLAASAPGEPVVVARTSHKSVLAGLILSGAQPVWVVPDVDEASGLALGVDYALLMVSRFREELAAGLEPREAARVTRHTAGRTTLFAGSTLLISMLVSIFILPGSLLASPPIQPICSVMKPMPSAP